jgi:hypothetical protein
MNSFGICIQLVAQHYDEVPYLFRTGVRISTHTRHNKNENGGMNMPGSQGLAAGACNDEKADQARLSHYD